MIDPDVLATVTETPVAVTIQDNSATVTITDNASTNITILEADANITVQADTAPVVTVQLGPVPVHHHPYDDVPEHSHSTDDINLDDYALTTHTHAAVDLSNYALIGHTHPAIDLSNYALINHTHPTIDLSGYSLIGHTHPTIDLSNYALIGHTHPTIDLSGYSLIGHVHPALDLSTYALANHTHPVMDLTDYALVNHTHPAIDLSIYALTGHSHPSIDLSIYALTNHTHELADIVDLEDFTFPDLAGYALIDHTHSTYALTDHTHLTISGNIDDIWDTLNGGLDTGNFLPGFITNLTNYNTLYAAIGHITVNADGDGYYDIQGAWTQYTDDEISQVTLAYQEYANSIISDYSMIFQNANSISLIVSHYEDNLADNQITTILSTIGVQAGEISLLSSTVYSNAAGTGLEDLIESNTASIEITSFNITQLVNTTITEHGEAILENEAGISNNAKAIYLWAYSFNILSQSVENAWIQLTSSSVEIGVLEEYANGIDLTVQSIMYQLANEWGVTITETTGGVSYVAGVSLLVNVSWVSGVTYEVGNVVYYAPYDATFECIVEHVATSETLTEEYWKAYTGGVHSSFTVNATSFSFIDPSWGEDAEPVLVFSASGDNFVINSELVNITGSVIVGAIDESSESQLAILNALGVGVGADNTYDAMVAATPGSIGAWISNALISGHTFITGGIISTGLLSAEVLLIGDPTRVANFLALPEVGNLASLDSLAGITPDMTVIAGGVIATNLVVADSIYTNNANALNAWIGDLTISTTGAIHGGKATAYSTTPGFWLGYYNSQYVFHFGDSTDYIGWTGTELLVGGNIISTSNLNVNAATKVYSTSNSSASATATASVTTADFAGATSISIAVIASVVTGNGSAGVSFYNGGNQIWHGAVDDTSLQCRCWTYTVYSAGTYQFTVTAGDGNSASVIAIVSKR